MPAYIGGHCFFNSLAKIPSLYLQQTRKNMIRKTVSLFALFILTSATLFAQAAKIGAWYNYFGNQGFGKGWNFHNEIQYRNHNLGGDLDQLLIRTGIGYNLTPNNNNILLGYGYILNQPYIADTDEKTEFSEHRIFQQFTTKQALGRVNMQHRYRVEERFFQDKYATRFRYHLSLTIPLNKKVMDKGAVYLSAYNELFINAQKEHFDRNRLYGAVGYNIRKDLRFEVGFMQQVARARTTNQLQVAIFNNIPFRKVS